MNGRLGNPVVSASLALLAGVLLLLLWQLASLFVGQELIIPSPGRTFSELILLLPSERFLAAVCATLLRGAAGFLLSLACGLVVGSAIGYFPFLRILVSPFLSVIRSTPVIAVILLALIWFRSDTVPVFVAFLTAFPIITATVAEGLANVDRSLLDMASSYRVNPARVFLHVYLPSVYPYLAAGAGAALGLTFKVVVAAEVLSNPVHAVGTGLAEAKIRLETAEVFAWTLVAIILSAVSEAVFSLIRRGLRRKVRG